MGLKACSLYTIQSQRKFFGLSDQDINRFKVGTSYSIVARDNQLHQLAVSCMFIVYIHLMFH
jgi:hypothetical protein